MDHPTQLRLLCHEADQPDFVQRLIGDVLGVLKFHHPQRQHDAQQAGGIDIHGPAPRSPFLGREAFNHQQSARAERVANLLNEARIRDRKRLVGDDDQVPSRRTIVEMGCIGDDRVDPETRGGGVLLSDLNTAVGDIKSR